MESFCIHHTFVLHDTLPSCSTFFQKHCAVNEWMVSDPFFFSPPDFSYFTSHCAGSELMDCYEVNEEHTKHNVSLVIHMIWRTGRQICTWGSICLMVLSKWVWHRSLFQSPEKVINVPLWMVFFFLQGILQVSDIKWPSAKITFIQDCSYLRPDIFMLCYFGETGCLWCKSCSELTYGNLK